MKLLDPSIKCYSCGKSIYFEEDISKWVHNKKEISICEECSREWILCDPLVYD